MKTTLKNIAIGLMLSFTGLFWSCEDDDSVSKPVITDLEIGIDNSRTAYVGSDLHVEAEIVAEGKIDIITIEIHQEEGSEDEIAVEYDEFEGLLNTTFHEHVDIPAETVPGEYHFHLTVTDQGGNQTTVEEDITIEALNDDEAPTISVTSSPESGQSFSSGETITIEGTVTDNSSLAGLLVALVKESDEISDDDVTGSNTSIIVMLHTHDFENEASHTFTASIEVGAEYDNNMEPAPIEGDNAWASGNYYILIKSKDANGNWAVSEHYPVTITL